jgi:ABC-type thiamin/hydroxymethylpyrimidine transport system permease subunit
VINMVERRPHFFSLHDLLLMAALAALGGVSSALASVVRAAAHAVIVLPGGFQFMAGIHVLWLVLAVGLVRKPGAATVTGILKGTVELLSGNPHGLLVLAYSLLAGLFVDAVWLTLGARDHPISYAIAGGVGATSNLLVLILVASIPIQGSVMLWIIPLIATAFLSGVFLAGLLGWCLLQALRSAGVVGGE